MYQDFCVRGCKGGAIEAEHAVALGVGGQYRIQSGVSEEVEGDDSLWDELVPQVHRECRIGAVEDGNEVVLPRSYRPLYGIAVMDSGGEAGDRCVRPLGSE